jgi:hypothetical protein
MGKVQPHVVCGNHSVKVEGVVAPCRTGYYREEWRSSTTLALHSGGAGVRLRPGSPMILAEVSRGAPQTYGANCEPAPRLGQG